MITTSTELVTTTASPPPWHVLPTGLADLLRPEIGSLSRRISQEIKLQIPEYSREDPDYARVIAGAVTTALDQLVERIADPATPREKCDEVHRALGRNEVLEGRSLDSLQRAYRIGTRLSWQRFMAVGARASISHETLLLLGEAIIAHNDELANLAVEGYTEREPRISKMIARRRRRLLENLLTQPLISEQSLEEAALAAKWPLPRSVVVVVLDQPIAEHEIPQGLRGNALADLDSGEPFLLVPAARDEDVNRENAFGGRRVVRSGPVALSDAANALQWARRVLVLIRQKILPDLPLTRCNDHLSSVLLLNDEPLALELVKEHLAPLGGLGLDDRIRLGHTLLSWLRTHGDTARVARRLEVDEDVVRERMVEISDLFGDTLHDPEACFELEVALRTASLLLRTGQQP